MPAVPVVRLGVRELETRLGIDRSTIWRWYKAGKFPEPHYLGDRRLWLLSEIEAFEAERMARPPEARHQNLSATPAGEDSAAV
ncbi:MAG: helix-turn-helix transcriptional regulator [Myxococcaceae bacterium]